MKSLILSAFAATCLVTGHALAEEHHHPTTAPTTAPATQQAVNAMCPIETEHPVDDRVFTVYKGQVIGFCCEDCQNEFKKDPEKYLARVEKKQN